MFSLNKNQSLVIQEWDGATSEVELILVDHLMKIAIIRYKDGETHRMNSRALAAQVVAVGPKEIQ